MPIGYSGKSEYCYANSLHMCLLGAGADAGTLSEPGFLECLTTMPFGVMYLRDAESPLFLYSPAAVSPDEGLDHALAALGWECEVWFGADEQGDQDEAAQRLCEAVGQGPTLLGPLDLGGLPYNPHAAALRGGDHFVVALEIAGERVVLHDPFGYPYATLAMTDLLAAWRAGPIPYKRGPYTMRWRFRQVTPWSRQAAIERTLPQLRETASFDPGGPAFYGGIGALRLLVADLRDSIPQELSGLLTAFAVPLGARRRLDASRFMAEAGNAAAADVLDRQARLLGHTQLHAVRDDWHAVAELMERFADAEQALINAL